MGEFVDAVAVRSSVDLVGPALVEFAAARGVHAALLPGTGPDVAKAQVTLYASSDEWTVTCWPGAGPPAAAAEAVSRELQTVASVISVYDGDFWTHVLFDRGRERDRFASMPDYFEEDPEWVEQLRREWLGNPAIVAATLGRSVDQISPYLVHESGEELEVDEWGAYIFPPYQEPAKAFPDDSAPIGVPWVFVDFWRRVGITYPDAVPPTSGLNFAEGWEGQLPSGTEWTL